VTAPLNPDQQTASQIIQQQLKAWGLDSLAGTVNDLIRQGLGSDAITLQLQQTDAYKQRFSANEARIKAGLAALSPAEYIATENAYRQVLQSYGLPSSFYDQPADFNQFLSNDVSPDELRSRVQVAQQVYLGSDPQLRDVWRNFYGLSDGAGIAAVLDESRSLPVLQNMLTAAQGGVAAQRSGLEANQGRLEQYAQQGFSVDQLSQGFSQIGQTLSADQAIARRNGTTFDQATAEAATITGAASALRKQQQLEESERALFSARAGADANSLNRRTSGSY
jgi:hypothetical protein